MNESTFPTVDAKTRVSNADRQEADYETRDVEYAVADTSESRSAAFRLLYSAYRRAGLIDENPYGARVTPYHLLPTTQVFVARCRQEVISTLSLIVDGALGVPMQTVFGDEVHQLRERGIRFGEVSGLADRRRDFTRSLSVFMNLTRLMAQWARRHGLEQLLVAVHPRHARFYQRMMGFVEIGGERTYPSVKNHPAVACALDFRYIDAHQPRCWKHYFANPLPEHLLVSAPMTEDEAKTWRGAVEESRRFLPLSCE